MDWNFKKVPTLYRNYSLFVKTKRNSAQRMEASVAVIVLINLILYTNYCLMTPFLTKKKERKRENSLMETIFKQIIKFEKLKKIINQPKPPITFVFTNNKRETKIFLNHNEIHIYIIK